MLAGGTIESFEGPNELDISNMKDWPLIDRNYQPTVFSSVRAMTSAKSVKTVGHLSPLLRMGSNSEM